ncbi:proline racemase family protein [Crenobacter intestini]|uniref:Proline racemase n=1 Tax=Crenobacter intestini TaxID=2563443 RepID=A0A4T0ULU7_9NEIS|nr:proline racemase family protein [Crenobacter intestini]TIC79684.1 proline racemase [Crenobacter intestini]
MKFSNLVQAVDAHTAGEPARVLTGGMPFIPGCDMPAKRAWFQRELDYLRTAVMLEPRGHADMFGSMLLAPTRDDADLGVLFLDSGGYLNMCVHGSIAAVTVAMETGIVPMDEGVSHLTLETPAGLVRAKAEVSNGRVREVAIANIPAFVAHLDATVDVPGLGSVRMDVAFGGNFFALVDAAQLGVALVPENAAALAGLGVRLRDAANAALRVRHPELQHIDSIDLVELYSHEDAGEGACCRNVVVFGDGQLDRSPCGTGTCAKMACLAARGQLAEGGTFVNESIIGTRFHGRVLGHARVGAFDAILPQVSGAAYITGFNQLLIDERDPVRHGFMLK